MIEYLSPSSLSLFESDRREFYLQRLAAVKRVKQVQTVPMAVGSAFDAFVKAYLYKRIHGDCAEYSEEALLSKQVDPGRRDVAIPAGRKLFNEYQRLGCMADLIDEMYSAATKPMFEFSIKDTISGVPLLGKPDVFFINKEGCRVVYDWKVNGFGSSSGASPTKGYVRLKPGNKMHKDCCAVMFKGLMINGEWFNNISPGWADQLSTYAWLVGEPVGSEQWIVGIDQVACRGSDIRIAAHRARVASAWQKSLISRYQAAWTLIQSGLIFTDTMSSSECIEYQKMLDVMLGGESEQDKWMRANC